MLESRHKPKICSYSSRQSIATFNEADKSTHVDTHIENSAANKNGQQNADKHRRCGKLRALQAKLRRNLLECDTPSAFWMLIKAWRSKNVQAATITLYAPAEEMESRMNLPNVVPTTFNIENLEANNRRARDLSYLSVENGCRDAQSCNPRAISAATKMHQTHSQSRGGKVTASVSIRLGLPMGLPFPIKWKNCHGHLTASATGYTSHTNAPQAQMGYNSGLGVSDDRKGISQKSNVSSHTLANDDRSGLL